MNHKQTSRKLTIKLFIILTLFLLDCQAFAQDTLPNLPNESHAFLSPAKEAQIGSAIMRQLRGTPLLSHDPILNEYLQYLGNRLIAHTSTTQFPYHFFGIDRFDANAFAFYGGYVGVHKGLILLTENESELAAVMAHEIAHTQQRHLARIALKNKHLLPITLLELLGAALVGIAVPDAGIHLIAGVLGGHIQQLINFTREHEEEADNIGIQILAKSNFEPFAMATVFERMSKATRFQNKPAEYLSTHPMFSRRIAMAHDRAVAFPYRQAKNTLQYDLIKAKLFAHSQPIKQVLIQYQKQAETKRYANKGVFLYGFGIAHLKNRSFKKAVPLFEQALTYYPNDPIVTLGLIEAWIRLNQLNKALSQAEKLHQLHPNHTSVRLKLATLLLKKKQAQKAKNLLIAVKKEHINMLPIYRLLAQAEKQLNQRDSMHHHLAYWHFLQGQFEQAQEQLKFAKKYIGKDPKKQAYLKKQADYFKDVEKKEKTLL